MKKSSFLTSSIGKKIIMGLSGFFLMIFLLVHLSVNLFLFWGEEAFNSAAHFMATNPIIQVSQFILAAGFILHIYLGIKLHLQNKRARGLQNYALNKWEAHSPFNSRTMIYTGLVVLCFLILHLLHFTIPIKTGNTHGMNDYELVVTLFKSPLYTFIYVVSFIFLAIHLSHGAKSAFQSVGAYHKKYNEWIKKFSQIYFWGISIGFSAIAIWFFLKS